MTIFVSDSFYIILSILITKYIKKLKQKYDCQRRFMSEIPMKRIGFADENEGK